MILNPDQTKASFSDMLPVLPLMSTTVFPLGVTTIQVGFEKNIKLIRDQARDQTAIVLAGTIVQNIEEIKSTDISTVGVVTSVLKVTELSGGSLEVTLEGRQRVHIVEFVQEQPYFKAHLRPVVEEERDTPQTKTLLERTLDRVGKLFDLDRRYPAEYYHIFRLNSPDPSRFADVVASTLHLGLGTKLKILETTNVRERLEKLIGFIDDEVLRLELSAQVESGVKVNLEKVQREFYLRQQLREIKRELGERDPQVEDAEQLQCKIDGADLPRPVREQALLEIERLRRLSTASAEYGVTKTYVEWLLDLPWSADCPRDFNLDMVEKELNNSFFGMEKVKERLLESFSVRRINPNYQGTVICLVGMPGTGKSSLAETLARALGRKFAILNVGGIENEAELIGERRGYPGAHPGRIMESLREAGVCNPVILLDEVDRAIGTVTRGGVIGALHSVLDPVTSRKFLDRYLGFPYDLSTVLFIATASSRENIPDTIDELLDYIELPSYLEDDKIQIAQRFLLPRILQETGLQPCCLEISDNALRMLIRQYAVEAGLWALRRELENLARKIARQHTKGGPCNWKVTEKNLAKILGAPIFIPDVAEAKPEIGVATGLAWTETGGDIMLIEALKMRGSGTVISTGSLGDVMKESIQASHSYVRSKADLLGIKYDDFTSHDIHIHFPSGAVPKDGPSAGVAISLVLASVMANRPIRNNIAMTGEVSLRGKVLPVGGIREKVSAAHRVGIETVLLPKQNEKDLENLPISIRKQMKFEFVEHIDDIFPLALVDFQPGLQSLENLLKQEVEKMRTARQKTSPKNRRRKADTARAKKPPEPETPSGSISFI